MYRPILRQIANTIYINIQNLELLGLLTGKLGVAIFFYNYALFTENEKYRELADHCVEFIYDKINQDIHIPKSFSEGLSGIGWGINYLIKNDFVEIEEDEDILGELNTSVSEINQNDFLLELDEILPLFSKGLYFLNKKYEKQIIEILDECYDLLSRTIRLNNVIPLSYLNSIFYFTNKAKSMKVEENICNLIIEKLYDHISDNVMNKNPSELDLYILNFNINNLNDSPKWQRMLEGKRLYLNILDRGWVNLVYDHQNDFQIEPSSLQTILVDKLQNPEEADLSIYRGLAGIGLELIRISLMKEKQI